MTLNIKKLLVVAAISLATSACGQRELEVSTKPIERAPLVVPQPDKMTLQDVQWFVIARGAEAGKDGSIETAWQRAKVENADSMFLLTPKNYENLSMNVAKLKAYILQLQAQVDAYKKYYERNN